MDIMQYYSILGIFVTLIGVVLLFIAVKSDYPVSRVIGCAAFLFIIMGQLTLCVLGLVRIRKINEVNTVNGNETYETVVIEETTEDRLYIPDRPGV